MDLKYINKSYTLQTIVYYQKEQNSKKIFNTITKYTQRFYHWLLFGDHVTCILKNLHNLGENVFEVVGDGFEYLPNWLMLHLL